jgi:hypothetical protein
MNPILEIVVNMAVILFVIGLGVAACWLVHRDEKRKGKKITWKR